MSTAEVIKIPPKYLNIADASRYCGLAKRTLERAARDGQFKNFVRSRRRLIVRECLDAWIEGRAENTEEQPRLHPEDIEAIAAAVARLMRAP